MDSGGEKFRWGETLETVSETSFGLQTFGLFVMLSHEKFITPSLVTPKLNKIITKLNMIIELY